jgi:hypothetical protein
VPDPITGTVIAKAASAAGSDMAAETGKLMQRILGPAADEFGQALARSVAYRTRNFGRIAAKGAKKASADLERGIVNPRVAYVLLDEGSLCDDELMDDYLGGVLAASRTPDGRDDRAVTWSRVITGLSSFQVRAHYLLYREWAARLHGADGSILGENPPAMATLVVDADEFLEVLIGDRIVGDHRAVLNHAIVGLFSAGLVGSDYVFTTEADEQYDLPAALALVVIPSLYGLELYAWAQGMPDLHWSEFASKAVPFEADESIPRLKRVLLPNLPGKKEG